MRKEMIYKNGRFYNVLIQPANKRVQFYGAAGQKHISELFVDCNGNEYVYCNFTCIPLH
jgi:hypothetical protein